MAGPVRIATLPLVCFLLTASARGVTVDNTDPGFAVALGSWSTGSSGTPQGADYRWATSVSEDAAEPTAVVEWRPNLPKSGLYEVATWYVAGANRASDATFTVNHAGGSTPIVVDQQNGGQQWFILGTFRFDAGSNGFVSLHNKAASGVVVADAVRFEEAIAEPGNLTIGARPPGSGKVTPKEGVECKHDFMEKVGVSAEAAPGYRFHHWEVSSGLQAERPMEPKTTITMDRTKTVTAVFVKPGPSSGEFRGLWADSHRPGFRSKAEIDEMIDRMAAANYNAVVAEVMAFQDTGQGGHQSKGHP